MKKTISMMTALVLVFSLFLTPTCFAYENKNTTVEDLGNGITVERTVTVYDSLLRSSTKKATDTKVYKNNGVQIASVTLTVTFGYDGSRAWVVRASGSHSVERGWKYQNEDITNSGGTSALTAEIKSTKAPGIVGVDLSLTCSKSGSIS